NRLSPLSPKRTGGASSVTPLIPSMHHEWYFNNVQNASGDVITIPDTGTVGGLDLSNPSLSNKPTQTSINGKIAYKGDGVDDVITRNTTDFGRSHGNWMMHFACVVQTGIIFSAFNNTNSNNDGWRVTTNNSFDQVVLSGFSSSGVVQNYVSSAGVVTNGNKYIITTAYTGTNALIY